MIATTRSTPGIAVRIVGRIALRRTARHRLWKLHGRRRLHLHRMYGARRERDLLYIPRIRLSVTVGFIRLGGEPCVRVVLPPRIHGQRNRDGCWRIGARFGCRWNGGQFVLGFVTGGSRIRYTVY